MVKVAGMAGGVERGTCGTDEMVTVIVVVSLLLLVAVVIVVVVVYCSGNSGSRCTDSI